MILLLPLVLSVMVGSLLFPHLLTTYSVLNKNVKSYIINTFTYMYEYGTRVIESKMILRVLNNKTTIFLLAFSHG